MSDFVLAPSVRKSTACVGVVDVGAYNTRDSEFRRGQLTAPVRRGLTVPSGRQVSPTELVVERALQRVDDSQPDAVVLGGAGPVSSKGIAFTNNGLVINHHQLRRVVQARRGRKIPVVVTNDALCGAAGILTLPRERIVQINGKPASLFTADEIIVVMLGTGMGIARLIHVGDRWMVKPSELSHVWARYGQVGYLDEQMRRMFGNSLELEHYVSGLGIVNITRALIQVTSRGSQAAQLLVGVPEHDQARFIADQAKAEDGHPLFREAMHRFREQLGYTLSALSMLLVPIVVAGRPATGNLPFLLEGDGDGIGPLRRAMRSRCRLSEVATNAQVYMVQDGPDEDSNELNLLGAGLIGASMLRWAT